MSTNARIGLQLNGGIVSVYHHWDGYPQWLGVQLTTKYTNKEDIAELIDGELIRIGKLKEWEAEFTGERGACW